MVRPFHFHEFRGPDAAKSAIFDRIRDDRCEDQSATWVVVERKWA
jgi:hypothetical protein